MARILIIDDSQVSLGFIARTLREKPHEVFTADSGEEAMTILASESLDLVITDIYMPPPDGIEILLRARSLRIHVPFIAMSARVGPLNVFLPARALGARLALQKPFTPEQLIAAVETVLNAASLTHPTEPISTHRP